MLAPLCPYPRLFGSATGAKDAKVKGIKHGEIARDVVEWAFALNKELGPGLLGNWMIKGRIIDRLYGLEEPPTL